MGNYAALELFALISLVQSVWAGTVTVTLKNVAGRIVLTDDDKQMRIRPPSSIGKVSNPGSEEELTGERPASGLVQISHFVNKQPETKMGLELEDVVVGGRRGVAVRAIAPGSVVAGELEVDDVIMAVDASPARSAVDVAAQMYAAGEGLSLLCIRAPIPIKRREPPMKQLRRSEWSSTERCGAATKVSASLALNCAAY